MYGTCHNKITVLHPCNGYRYGRSTGTGTGVARLYVATYVRAYCRYSYGRMTDMALRGVAYIRTVRDREKLTFYGRTHSRSPTRLTIARF